MPTLRVKTGATYNSQLAIGTVLEILAGFQRRGPVHVYCEQVGSRPGAGAVQMFRFGENFGVLKGIFGALGYPVSFVHPAEWKRVTRCPREKDAARLRASQVFPVWAPTFTRTRDDGRAESAMLALYGAMRFRNPG